ncbi:ABC transporter permease [Achromobacter sp. 413638]|uniref:ABC transporter permease n=1 Tax=Achromobacter sp. 413638 TaxID=3342385 RepID=UPI00370B9AF7
MPDITHGPSFAWLLDEAVHSLRSLGRRSILALLGIMVGSAAIIALLNIGHNAAEDVMRAFRQMGTDRLVVNFPIVQNARPLPATLDTAALRQAVPALSRVAPLSFFATTVRHGGKTAHARLIGATADLAPVINLTMATGRFLSEFDQKSTFAVVGAQLARELGGEGRPLQPGDRLQIGSYLFDVIGVTRNLAPNSLIPIMADLSIMVPIDGLRRLHSSPEVGSILARADPAADLAVTAHDLQQYLQDQLGGRPVDVQIPRQLLDGLKHQADTFSYLLAGLGGISLLVGGVGVMNVMLMNVAERRREIGVRLALGARPRDIRALFLLEAGALSIAGALLGALLGLLSAYAFSRYSGWTFSLAPYSLPLGVGSSLLIGVFFGIHPAVSAARLHPVEALRDA